MMHRLASLFLAAIAVTLAQPIEPRPPLENSGKPMRVPLACSTEDLQAAGLSCSEDEPCPMYLELSAVEGTPARIIIAGNIHGSTATISSILLTSSDGAATWTEPQPRIPLSSLDQIQFIDAGTGWIAGALIQPLPRDPFFLLTTDGGNAWRRQSVFEETHAGGVERFQFDSPKSGVLFLTPVDGKHEVYETMTGGESWTLREIASKPTAPPRSSKAESPWRISANAKTHCYDVELNGERVASFLVEIGACK